MLRPGKALGEITGGNLSLVFSLLGTHGEPETSGKILFLEDIGEYDYPVVFDFPAGHINDNRAFYFGRKAELTCTGASNRLKFI